MILYKTKQTAPIPSTQLYYMITKQFRHSAISKLVLYTLKGSSSALTPYKPNQTKRTKEPNLPPMLPLSLIQTKRPTIPSRAKSNPYKYLDI